MPDTPEPGSRSAPPTPSVAAVRARLDAAARLLGESAAVDPEVRRAFSELMDELSQALDAPDTPPAEVARLADGAAHLAEAIHHQHDQGLLTQARERLERLMFNAEARAPTAVGLTKRLIDALANLGI
jgi:hypothetical protein